MWCTVLFTSKNINNHNKFWLSKLICKESGSGIQIRIPNADPDPGRRSIADPDPKHWLLATCSVSGNTLSPADYAALPATCSSPSTTCYLLFTWRDLQSATYLAINAAWSLPGTTYHPPGLHLALGTSHPSLIWALWPRGTGTYRLL